MEIEILIKETVKIDLGIDTLIDEINRLPMANRWNHVAQLLNGIGLNEKDLSAEQRKIIRKYLERWMAHVNVDTYLLDCGSGVKLKEIGLYETNDDEQVESISLDFEYNNKTYEVMWLAENIGDLDYPMFSGIDGPSEGFAGFKASVESYDVLKVLVPYCQKWIANENESLKAEVLD